MKIKSNRCCLFKNKRVSLFVVVALKATTEREKETNSSVVSLNIDGGPAATTTTTTSSISELNRIPHFLFLSLLFFKKVSNCGDLPSGMFLFLRLLILTIHSSFLIHQKGRSHHHLVRDFSIIIFL